MISLGTACTDAAAPADRSIVQAAGTRGGLDRVPIERYQGALTVRVSG